MGSSSKRNQNKKSRAQLLAHKNNSDGSEGSEGSKGSKDSKDNNKGQHRAPPQDRPSSSFFSGVVPTLVQFAFTWIAVVCCIKALDSYNLLPPILDSSENITSTSPSASIINAVTNHDDSGMDTMKTNQQQQQQQQQQQKHSSELEANTPLAISTKLRSKFHPVVKFPIKTIYEEEEEQKKMKKVKRQSYHILDFTSTHGSSQLIQPNDQTDFITKRKLENKQQKKSFVSKLFAAQKSKQEDDTNNRFTVGKYDENRKQLYSSSLFQNKDNEIDGYDGARTIHMGIDLGGPVGTKVYSFWKGKIHSLGYNDELGDYGYVIVVQYSIPIEDENRNRNRNGNENENENENEYRNTNRTIWALYGHLDKSIMKKKVGQNVRRGQFLGHMGDVNENGGWRMPHVHFQLSTIEPETHDMPGAVSLKDRSRALLEYPDPQLVLGPLY